jgi:hypothetical protein
MGRRPDFLERKGSLPEVQRAFRMKTLIFLIFFILVISGMFWKMRKSQAEADLVQRKSIERKRKKEKEAVTTDEDMIWPVIIKPVSGEGAPDEEPEIEEPSMTTIEYEPPEKMAG